MPPIAAATCGWQRWSVRAFSRQNKQILDSVPFTEQRPLPDAVGGREGGLRAAPQSVAPVRLRGFVLLPASQGRGPLSGEAGPLLTAPRLRPSRWRGSRGARRIRSSWASFNRRSTCRADASAFVVRSSQAVRAASRAPPAEMFSTQAAPAPARSSRLLPAVTGPGSADSRALTPHPLPVFSTDV